MKIARVMPRTEHSFWLHQLVCGVMLHMKNWGPLPDTSAYWLERQQKFLKGQIHSQLDPEMTLFKRWSEVAGLRSTLGQALSDLQYSAVMPNTRKKCFQFNEKQLKLQVNPDEPNKLLCTRKYKLPEVQRRDVILFLEKYWKELRLSRVDEHKRPTNERPDFSALRCDVTKHRRAVVRAVPMMCAEACNKRYAGGTCAVAKEDLKRDFPGGVRSSARYGAHIRYYLAVALTNPDVTLELAAVELLRCYADPKKRGMWLCKAVPDRKEQLQFLPLSSLEMPCVTADVPTKGGFMYWIPVDDSILPDYMQEAVDSMVDGKYPAPAPAAEQDIPVVDLDALYETDNEAEQQQPEEKMLVVNLETSDEEADQGGVDSRPDAPGLNEVFADGEENDSDADHLLDYN